MLQKTKVLAFHPLLLVLPLPESDEKLSFTRFQITTRETCDNSQLLDCLPGPTRKNAENLTCSLFSKNEQTTLLFLGSHPYNTLG